MKPHLLLFAVSLLTLLACKNETPGPNVDEDGLAGTYQGTVTLTYVDEFEYPDGSQERIDSVETFTDRVTLRKVAELTYEVEQWESGWNGCMVALCPGSQVVLSDSFTFVSGSSYDNYSTWDKVSFDPDSGHIVALSGEWNNAFQPVYSDTGFVYAYRGGFSHSFEGKR